jgi:hypothetical protein
MADTGKTLEVLQALQDLTDKLTWRRIATALLAGIVALVLFTGYEHRGRLVHAIMTGVQQQELYTDWDISGQSGQQLRWLVEQNSLVSMIMVEKIDLQKNRRIPKFWFLNKSQDAFTKALQGRLPDAAFDDDSQSVQQLIGILNNEFVCSKFEDTSLAHFFPQLKDSTPYVCSIAVPPFYGRMLGILTFGLSTRPTQSEHAAIRAEATRLAVELYLHDIAKRSK